MGLVLGSYHESLCSFSQQQHGRRYRAQGGISSGTQVGLVRHYISAVRFLQECMNPLYDQS